MKPRVAAALLGLFALLLLALPAAAGTRTVRVGYLYFEDDTAPAGEIVINAGDRLSFFFEDGQHTATVDGMFESDQQTTGRTWTTGPLTRVGTYTLYCRDHGASEHSTTLVIRSTTSPSPTAARPTRSPASKPSPARTKAPAASPSPRIAVATPSPTPRPSTSGSPTPVPSASPSAAAVRTPSADEPSSAPSPVPSTADVARARPLADEGVDWQLPALLLLVLGLGAGAIAVGRRRRTG